ncbi:MAG: hypothetical protein PVJ07_06585 [Anaerolineales bacterium]
MKNRLTILVLVLILAGLACGGPGATPPPGLPTEPPATSPPATSPPVAPTPDPHPDWLTYTNSDCGFQIRVPPDSIITPGAGSANITLTFLPDTNLREKYLEVTCTAAGTLPSDTRVFNGITFAYETGSDAGAGNRWNWTTYTATTDGLAAELMFMLHSVNPMNYTPPIPEFDEAYETAVFDMIMGTFVWLGP